MNALGGHAEEQTALVPFIVCRRQGGEFADEPFAAGFECGQIYSELHQCAALGALPRTRWLHQEVARQVDLFAMALGYTVTVLENDGEGLVRIAFSDPHTGSGSGGDLAGV